MKQQAEPRQVAGRNPVVLAVDDSANNLRLIRGILTGECDLQVAINGERALELAIARPMRDLILLDVMMPGRSGHEVCRRAEEGPRTSRIPVLFVTVLGEGGESGKGVEAGAGE